MRIFYSIAFWLPLSLVTGMGSAAVLNVPSGGDLQGVLNAAQPGDTITLARGGSYVGFFTLPAKSGSAYITITTADASSLPAEGQRVNPSTAAAFPKIIAPGSASAITAAPGAQHYILRGLEVTVSPGVYAMDLVSLSSSNATDITTYPTDIIVDQCYIHGDPNVGGKRGVALNGAQNTIENSYLSDFKSSIQDAQAICGWYGPGPYVIQNNYLEGAQGILIGGAAPSIAGMVPSNIQILNNHITRPMSWKGVWGVKNLIELKNAQDVNISYNILENNWTSNQNGFGVLFTVRTCEAGDYEWAVVKNVSFTYNIVNNSDQGVNILGEDNARSGCSGPSIAGQTSDVLIENNLFERIGLAVDGTFLQVLSNTENLTVDHNTVLQGGRMVLGDGAPNPGFVFLNNITLFQGYGIVGDNVAEGISALNTYFPGWVFAQNVVANIPSSVTSLYPPNNFYLSSVDQVGFANYAGQNYALSAASPYKCAGTDGHDIGADIGTLLNATSTVISGNGPASSPIPYSGQFTSSKQGKKPAPPQLGACVINVPYTS